MPDVAQHELSLGDLPLVAADPTVKPYEIHALAEGTEFGNPEPVMVEIRSMLLDGSLARILNYDNRTIPVQVEITGASLDDVAQGEADVMAEVRKGRNELRWLPPDSMAAPTVFDVIWTRMDRSYGGWDMDERRFVRTFVLTIAAAPFGRDDEETAVAAIAAGVPPPTPITLVVADGTSAAGWTANYPTISTGGGSVTVTGTSPGRSAATLWMQRPGAIDMSTTPYFYIDWQTPGRGVAEIKAFADGVALERISSAVAPTAGFTRTFFAPPSVATSLRMEAAIPAVVGVSAPNLPTFSVDQIVKTNVSPFVGTGRQQFRALKIGGSARTTGSIQLAHETDALAEVLVYTSADDGSGYQPACRQYRTDGGTITADATTASGSRSPLNAATAETYDIPARSLPPGVYAVIARIKGSAPAIAGAYWRASTRVGSTNLGTKFADFNEGIIGVLPTWQLYDLGTVTLPPVALPAGSNSFVRLDMRSSQALEIDETWLFNLTTGAFSWIRCGLGTPALGGASSRLWIDTPALDWPRPSVWLGTSEDKTLARHAMGAEVASAGTHLLEPGVVNLFTYSDALNVAASARFYRRHQFHATKSDD